MKQVSVAGAALVAVSGFVLRDNGASAQPDPTQLARELLGLTADDVLHDWTELEVSGCMRDTGFPFQPRPFEPVRETAGLDVAAAERADRGFGISTQTTDPQPLNYDDPVARIASSLDDARRDAFFAQLDECGGQVAKTAEERRAEVIDQLSPADMTFFEDTLSGQAAAAQAALEGWTSCMESAGHPYANQQEMLGSVEAQWTELAGASPEQVEELRSRERAVAVADASCDATHLAPYRADVLDELTRRLGEYSSLESIYVHED